MAETIYGRGLQCRHNGELCVQVIELVEAFRDADEVGHGIDAQLDAAIP